ncbi:unnamed protein product, partial [marine sediment metagenome]
ADANTDKIYKINPNNGGIVPGDSFGSPGKLPQGLAWDGEYLWNVDSYEKEIYKIDSSNGDVLQTIPCLVDDPTGLAFGNDYLWLADNDDDKIYMINPSNGKIVGSKDSPGTDPQGLAWNGEKLLNADARYDKIYIVDVDDIILEENNPPSEPIINGPSNGKPGEKYSFTFKAIDPDEGDEIYYYIEWGDDDYTGWLGPHNSGESITKSHTWEERESFTIRAKAKDQDGEESGWATKSISFPRDRANTIAILSQIFERFPLLEKMAI